MIQSRTSLKGDLPPLVEGPWRSALYLEVDDLDAITKQVKGAPVVVPRRTTSYGAQELWVREPGGNVIAFAQQAP